eukprot:15657-Heterococcus_DN1.PRE.1
MPAELAQCTLRTQAAHWAAQPITVKDATTVHATSHRTVATVSADFLSFIAAQAPSTTCSSNANSSVVLVTQLQCSTACYSWCMMLSAVCYSSSEAANFMHTCKQCCRSECFWRVRLNGLPTSFAESHSHSKAKRSAALHCGAPSAACASAHCDVTVYVIVLQIITATASTATASTAAAVITAAAAAATVAAIVAAVVAAALPLNVAASAALSSTTGGSA